MPYGQINELCIGVRGAAPTPVGLVDKDMYNKDVLLLIWIHVVFLS